MSSSPPESSSNNQRSPSLVDELDDALGEFSVETVPTVFLIGLSGKFAGKLFKIRQGESLIGRTSKALVILDERAVSHKHAKLTLTADGCVLEDLTSTNGTFLNDVRIDSPVPLHAGDVIRVGNNALGFLTDAEDEQQHTRAMARLTAPRPTFPPPGQSSRAPASGGILPENAQSQNGQVIHVYPGSGYPPPVHHLSGMPAEVEINALDSALDKMEVILGFLRRYWKVIAVSTFACGTLGLAIGTLKPLDSVASFEIYLRQDSAPDPSRPQHEQFGMQGGEFFTFAERKFSEPALVQETLKEMGKPANRFFADLVAMRLHFSPIDRMGTYRGEFADKDGEFAERFLTNHLQNFLEVEINKALKVHASEVALMRREYEKNEAKLKEVEAELRKFKEDHVGTLPEPAMSQIQNKGSLLAQRDSLIADISHYSAELSLARKQLASEDSIVGTKVAKSEPYEKALADVNQEIAAAQAKGFAPGHPELVRLREEQERLETLKKQAIEASPTETDRIANAEYRRLSDSVGKLGVELNAAEKELSLVQSRLGEIESLSGKLPGVEAEITRLVRARAAAEEIHERLNVDLKAKELELQFQRASVTARYEMMVPPHYVTPPRSKTLLKFGGAGAVAGLIGGVLIGMLRLLINYSRERKANQKSTALLRT